MFALGPASQAAAYMRAGTPHLQVCTVCGECSILPIALCRSCGIASLRWQPLDPRGHVYSATVVRRKPEHGGDTTVVLIELVQGPRLMSRLIGVAPGDARLGMPVVAEVGESADGHVLVFRPDPAT